MICLFWIKLMRVDEWDEILCDWCGKVAVWLVKDNYAGRDTYMCEHHYNSHARSPLAKCKKLQMVKDRALDKAYYITKQENKNG